MRFYWLTVQISHGVSISESGLVSPTYPLQFARHSDYPRAKMETVFSMCSPTLEVDTVQMKPRPVRIVLINAPLKSTVCDYSVGHQLPLGLLMLGGPLLDAGFSVAL